MKILGYCQEDPEVRLTAIHALGLIGDKSDIEEIKKMLSDEDDEVKLEAVTVLGKTGDIQVIKDLRNLWMKKVKNPSFKLQIALALKKIIK